MQALQKKHANIPLRTYLFGMVANLNCSTVDTNKKIEFPQIERMLLWNIWLINKGRSSL